MLGQRGQPATSTECAVVRAGVRERVERLHWFHSIDFGNGLISRGTAPLSLLQSQADIYFGEGISGKSVVDIGCWDGFNSVEAIRQGASRVLATDHWVWHHHPWASRETIELVRKELVPELEIMEIDAADLTEERIGQFDIVLFCGVFYHLRNPFLTLESIAKLARETLIVETAMDAADVGRPAMIFYPDSELNGDPSNWWGPNRACVEAMMWDVGFTEVEFIAHPMVASRGIFRGRRGS